MLPRSLIVGFLWRFVLVYGLLIAPWPGFNAAYGRYFRAWGELTFARENGRWLVHFEPVPAELHHVLDTRIVLANRDQRDGSGAGPGKYLELDTRGVGWVPTALLFALILATPVPWWRRVWALLWGMVAVHGFILFSVAIYLWSSAAELALITPAPFLRRVADGVVETLVTQMGASFVVPVVLWLLATIRRQDVTAWQGAPSNLSG